MRYTATLCALLSVLALGALAVPVGRADAVVPEQIASSGEVGLADYLPELERRRRRPVGCGPGTSQEPLLSSR